MTGGASGLGRATAERFVQQGARVVICDLPKSEGQEVASAIGENCAFASTDVSVCLQSLMRSASREIVRSHPLLDLVLSTCCPVKAVCADVILPVCQYLSTVRRHILSNLVG